MADNSFQVLARLDINKSAELIKTDIQTLENKLKSESNSRLKILAGLDVTKSKNLIQSQLATIANQANAPTINVGISAGNQNAMQNIFAGLKDVQTQAQQTARTVNQTSQSITNLADKFIQPIKPVFNKDGLIDAEKTITKVQRHFKELGEVSTKGIYGDNNSVDSLDKMIVRVKTLLGETRSLNFELDKTGNAFYLKSGTSDNSGVEKLINAQLRFKSQIESTTTSLKSQLDTIKASYSDANSTKYISSVNNKNALTEQYNKAIDAINRLNNADSTTMASMKANAKSEIAVLQQLVKQFQNAEYAATSLRTKDIGTIKINQQNDLSKFIGQVSGTNIFSAMKSDIDALSVSLSKVTDSKSLTAYLNQLDNVKTKFEALKSLSVTMESNLTKLQALQNQAVFKNNASNPEVIKAKADIATLIGEYQKLKTQLQGNVTPEGLKQVEATLTTLNSRFSDTKDSAKVLQTALAQTNGQDKLIQKTNLLIARIEAYRSANSKAEKSYGDLFDNMLSELRSGSLDNIGVDRVSKQFQTLRQEISLTGKAGKTFWEKLKEQAEKFSSWMSLTGIITSAWHELQKMVTNVVELDDSLLELSKVSDLTASGIKNITTEAYSLGKEVGKTGTQVINAITNFKRAGFDMRQSVDFAEDALILTNVAEGINDTGEAATALISIMKGYGDTTSEFSQKILDSINQVSNTQAINFDDLVDGSQRLSAVAKQAGASFEQMLGILTGTNEVLQNIEKTASGEITIFTRLQGIQLPDEEDVMPIAKLQETINSATKGAANVVDQTTGELRNVYDILNDINEVWDTLDKNTQEGIAFAAAGTRQKNVFLSMMENWKNVESATESAMNSIGSSAEENQKYLDSISGKLANMESSFQSLSNTVVNSGLIKFAVDSGTDILNFLDGTIDKLGTIPTLLTAISAGMAFKNVGGIINTPILTLL